MAFARDSFFDITLALTRTMLLPRDGFLSGMCCCLRRQMCPQVVSTCLTLLSFNEITSQRLFETLPFPGPFSSLSYQQGIFLSAAMYRIFEEFMQLDVTLELAASSTQVGDREHAPATFTLDKTRCYFASVSTRTETRKRMLPTT